MKWKNVTVPVYEWHFFCGTAFPHIHTVKYSGVACSNSCDLALFSTSYTPGQDWCGLLGRYYLNYCQKLALVALLSQELFPLKWGAEKQLCVLSYLLGNTRVQSHVETLLMLNATVLFSLLSSLLLSCFVMMVANITGMLMSMAGHFELWI